jgi:hypothetical protein
VRAISVRAHLMDATTKRALELGRESVTAKDVEYAVRWTTTTTMPPMLLATPSATYAARGDEFVRSGPAVIAIRGDRTLPSRKLTDARG